MALGAIEVFVFFHIKRCEFNLEFMGLRNIFIFLNLSI
jgi:hypothetical protein